jgi:hypothetical protein
MNPRKTKEIQGKLLGFPWVPLAELGLSNGLQRIQIKESSCVSTRLPGCGPNLEFTSFRRRRAASAVDPHQ